MILKDAVEAMRKGGGGEKMQKTVQFRASFKEREIKKKGARLEKG